MARTKELTPSGQKLARHQQGRCPVCGESLFTGEALHRHHKLPRVSGGLDTYANLTLLHAACHQHVHAHTSGGAPARHALCHCAAAVVCLSRMRCKAHVRF